MKRVVLIAALFAPLGDSSIAAAGPKAKRLPEIVLESSQVNDATEYAIGEKVMKSYVGSIKRCYVARLAAAPDANGALVVTFTVGRAGKTSAVAAQSFDPKLERCVATAARAWRFAASKQDVADANYALTFWLDTVDNSPETKRERETIAFVDSLDGGPERPESGADLSRRVQGAATGDSATELTPEAVATKVRSTYMAGLNRCHKRAGTDDTTGGISFAFTVRADGSPTDVTVKGARGTLAACMKSRIATWRFPAPKAGEAVRIDLPLTM